MQLSHNFLRRPSIYFVFLFAALFLLLSFTNEIYIWGAELKVIFPVILGGLVGYIVCQRFEKLNLQARIREEKQQEIISSLQEQSAHGAKSRVGFEFIASSSHELLTPLNAIIGFSELLIEDLESNKEKFAGQINDLDKINKAGQHLFSLINDLLDLSKINSGNMELIKEKVDVELLFQELKVISDPMVKMKNNQLLIDSTDIPNVYADEMKLKQCLLILISNAAKFTEDGVITLSAKQKDEGILFTVVDSSTGMAAEQLSRVFESFEQNEICKANNYGVTGLGLLLTKQFVELMDGTISVNRNQNLGSSLTILLPSV